MTEPIRPKLATRLRRALARRCPHCGEGAFRTYFDLHDECPRCGLHFERESGYWVGALIINTAFIFGTFLVTLVGGAWLTWPDVPWTGLLVVLIAVNLTLPILFYPQSKTIWAAFEMGWNPVESSELNDRAQHRAG